MTAKAKARKDEAWRAEREAWEAASEAELERIDNRSKTQRLRDTDPEYFTEDWAREELDGGSYACACLGGLMCCVNRIDLARELLKLKP